MFAVLHALGMLVGDLFKSRARLEAEILLLRHQLNLALRHAPPRVRGIRDRPISPRAPWQNGIAERLIGMLRRECLDHVVVFGERHLRRVLSAYAAYYNQTRPHRSLRKDAPSRRAVQRIGDVTAIPILGGLHHKYVRICFGKDRGLHVRRRGQTMRGPRGTPERIRSTRSRNPQTARHPLGARRQMARPLGAKSARSRQVPANIWLIGGKFVDPFYVGTGLTVSLRPM